MRERKRERSYQEKCLGLRASGKLLNYILTIKINPLRSQEVKGIVGVEKEQTKLIGCKGYTQVLGTSLPSAPSHLHLALREPLVPLCHR